jgi:hypothetical protein
MSDEEIRQWDDLYQYVKNEILQYDSNQKIAPKLVLRLKGLKEGKLIAKNSTEKRAEYSFEVILNTFKICKVKILNATHNKCFKDDTTKFFYICAIIENEINDVYLRMQNVKKTNIKIENLNTENIYHEGAEYKPVSNKKINEKLKKIW